MTLPPYAPELNPIEPVWDELREKFFHNRVFKSIDALEEHLTTTLKTLEDSPTQWAPSSLGLELLGLLWFHL